MRRSRAFLLTLSAFLALYGYYGLNRYTLGIDFTDEGAYLAWPYRMLFGEKPFSSELLTLLRPVEVFLYLPFKLHPGMTLYEFRLIGWSLHLLSFGCLASYLFRLCDSPLISCLIASVPLFVSHIFGLASPSYNGLSSDFMVVALSLKGLSSLQETRWRWHSEMMGSVALFAATFSHPALILIGAIVIIREMIRHSLVPNLIRGRLVPSNAGAIVFVGCWLALAIWLFTSGVLNTWLERFTFVRTLSEKSLPSQPIAFYRALLFYPFNYSKIAVVLSAAGAVVLLAPKVFSPGIPAPVGNIALTLALLVTGGIILTFRFQPENLTGILVLMTAILFAAVVAVPSLSRNSAEDPEKRFLMLVSVVSALIYATFTFYFSAHRSWISGSLGLPFAFAAGLASITKIALIYSRLARPLISAALALAVCCVARDHYDNIQRDAPRAKLVAPFSYPKLHGIKSTPERVHAVEALCNYLLPRLARGQELLVYDDCPMLYYLLDTRPAYGLAWAVRYSQSMETLALLDAEFRARPLPQYAIRTLVDVSQADWSRSAPTQYDHYPINETVLANYDLEKTVFPFEIWRLRAAPPHTVPPIR